MDTDDVKKLIDLAKLLDVDLSVYGIDEDEMYELYDNMLDEVHEAPSVGICTMKASDFLRENDETGYRCGYSDWTDSMSDTYTEIGDRYCDADAIQDIKDDLIAEIERM